MPKLKTHSGTKKRVRLTKTGKVVRRHATGNHFLEKKSASRKRRFAGVEVLSGKQSKNIRRQLGV
ncbi:50S ribosomal protein L35 [Candidatus Saccharibacteria bacterium]|nr:50S ribosomal protein L35 [Candidatus Saccharibacteria bacterium]